MIGYHLIDGKYKIGYSFMIDFDPRFHLFYTFEIFFKTVPFAFEIELK